MKTELLKLAGRQCRVYKNELVKSKEKYLIVQPVDVEWISRDNVETEILAAHVQPVDVEWVSRNDVYEHTPVDIEVEKIMDVSHSEIVFANFGVEHWNDELSPWSADAVFKNQSFGGKAENTLDFVTNIFIPALAARYNLTSDIKIIIGGYSLAGLFSLWAAYRTDIFHSVAAVSPSVWFSGWIDFATEKHIFADKVYLSLGNREEKTNNKTMARVGDNIRMQKELLDMQGVQSILEWNDGNHFKDVEARVAKGFLWTITQ